VGSLTNCTWILGLAGFRVTRVEIDGDVAEAGLQVHVERRGVRRYPCAGCGRRTGGNDCRRWSSWAIFSSGISRGIAAYCDHPVRFGVVESVNTTIKAVIRRARGMQDGLMLVLKLKWATARPIRTARDLPRFLHPESVH